MGGDIVLRKMQTANIDTIVKNKRGWDCLAMEYEAKTFLKHITQFVHQQNLLHFGCIQALLDHLKGKPHNETV